MAWTGTTYTSLKGILMTGTRDVEHVQPQPPPLPKIQRISMTELTAYSPL